MGDKKTKTTKMFCFSFLATGFIFKLSYYSYTKIILHDLDIVHLYQKYIKNISEKKNPL